MKILIPIFSNKLFLFSLNEIQKQYPNEEIILFATGLKENYTTLKNHIFEYNEEMENTIISFLISNNYKVIQYEGLKLMDSVYLYLLKHKQGLIVSPSLEYLKLMKWVNVGLQLYPNKEPIHEGLSNIANYHCNIDPYKLEIIKKL